MLWSNVIDVLRGSLFVLAHWCGGSMGAAILLASAAIRVALLPITLPAARRRLAREDTLRELAPEIERLNHRYASDPRKLMRATQELYASHGVAMFDRSALVDSLVSFPPGIALYAAVRSAAETAGGFLWIANLAKPDRLLALGASVIAGGLAWSSAAAPATKGVSPLLPVLITAGVGFLMLSHFSAGVALYSISNSIIGGAERVIARRTIRSSVR